MKKLIPYIFIAILAAFGFMISRDAQKQVVIASPAPSEENGVGGGSLEGSPAATVSGLGQNAEQPTGNLIILTKTKGTTEIQRLEISTKKVTTLFSDKDKSKKIVFASPASRDGDTLVALLSEDPNLAGDLVAISLDGSGKSSTLIENFISTNPPVISPDKSKLAMVSFSNAEPNFGFNLVIMDVNGKNQKTLATDSSGISHPAFSPDGKQIAYIQGAEAKTNQIKTVATDGSKNQALFEIKGKIIEDFDWNPLGLLTLSAIDETKKSPGDSEVYIADPKSKELGQITKNNLAERTPKLAPDGNGIAYIQIAGDKATNLGQLGDLMVSYTDSTNQTKISTASQILGWVK